MTIFACSGGLEKFTLTSGMGTPTPSEIFDLVHLWSWCVQMGDFMEQLVVTLTQLSYWMEE